MTFYECAQRNQKYIYKLAPKIWNATAYKHYTGTIRHTYTQLTTQRTVIGCSYYSVF